MAIERKMSYCILKPFVSTEHENPVALVLFF